MALDSNGSNGGSVRAVSDSHRNQITILTSMSTEAASGRASDVVRSYEIGEIGQRAAMKDEKEVLRYLYILEGQKLVTPVPEGDFTSKSWQITKEGIKALKMIQRSSHA